MCQYLRIRCTFDFSKQISCGFKHMAMHKNGWLHFDKQDLTCIVKYGTRYVLNLPCLLSTFLMLTNMCISHFVYQFFFFEFQSHFQLMSYNLSITHFLKNLLHLDFIVLLQQTSSHGILQLSSLMHGDQLHGNGLVRSRSVRSLESTEKTKS